MRQWQSWILMRRSIVMKKSKLMAMVALSSAVLFGALVGVASDARAVLNGTGWQYIYKIVNVNSGKVLDVEHGSKEATSRLVQWEYLGLKSQQWTVLANGNGTYTIVNVNSGMAIEPAAVTNGARIWQRDYSPGRDLQHW